MKNKSDAPSIIIFVLTLLALITMSCGIVVLYNNKKDTVSNNVKVIVKQISLFILYNQEENIYMNKLDNHIDYNYTFSISNASTYDVKYGLSFITNTFPLENESDTFKYSLKCNTKNKSSIDKTIELEKKVSSSEEKLGEAFITGDQVHYCTLNIKYDGEEVNKPFIGKVVLEKAIE